MTKQETYMVMATLEANYPMAYKNMSKEKANMIAGTWYSAFKDIEGVLVLKAVNAYCISDIKGFPPNTGQVNQLIQKTAQNGKMSELEAWGLVRKAIKNSAYESKKEFNKLPQIIRKVVGSPDSLYQWSQTKLDELETVVASNFQRSYREKSKEQDFIDSIPNDLKLSLGVSDTFIPDVSLPEPIKKEQEEENNFDILSSLDELINTLGIDISEKRKTENESEKEWEEKRTDALKKLKG